MRKYILILFALTCSLLSSYAMNLEDAYNALSHLPKISTELNDTVNVSVNKVNEKCIMKVSGVRNLDRKEIKTIGDATLAILNQVPLSYMINGGSNELAGAFVYCTPNANGLYDMLIVTLSVEQGDLTNLYVTDVDENPKLCIQEGKLTLEDSSLSIIPSNNRGIIGAIKVKLFCRGSITVPRYYFRQVSYTYTQAVCVEFKPPCLSAKLIYI